MLHDCLKLLQMIRPVGLIYTEEEVGSGSRDRTEGCSNLSRVFTVRGLLTK